MGFIVPFSHCMYYILSISLSDFVGIVSPNANVLRYVSIIKSKYVFFFMVCNDLAFNQVSGY